jgi:transposase
MSTPPRRQARKHWETPTRAQALTLLEEGHSQRQISCRTSVPQSTVARWNKNRNLMRRNNFRTGRPKKLTQHNIRRLIGILRSSWEGRKFSWENLAKKAGLHVSSKTIKRALNWDGYHRCRAFKSHLSIGKLITLEKYMQSFICISLLSFGGHMYSDECSFDTSIRGTTWVTRLRHGRYHGHCIDPDFQSGRVSVMVWGAIC